MEETPEKESAFVAQEGDELATSSSTRDRSTSTRSTTDGGVEVEVPPTTCSEADEAAKAASCRSFHACRQTVEELEARAQGDKSSLKKSLSRASSNSTQSQPGAVAMYRSDTDGSDSSLEQALEESRLSADAPAETEEVPIIHVELAAEEAPPTVPIQAHLAEEVPEATIAIPQAQLVPPPQEAYHVQFDEEAPPPPADNAPELLLHPEPQKLQSIWKKHGRPCFRFSVLLLVVGLIAGIVAPRIHEQKRSEDLEDRLEWLEGLTMFGEDFPQMPGLTAPTPAPSHQTVYDCYDSTLKIAMAQAENPSKAQFILCPNTLIPLGSLNEDNEIEGGDYPLTALGDKVEIRCGLDGRRENHCYLEGGFVQVLLQPSLPHLLSGESVNRTDHVVFRGITFRGDLNATNEMMGGVSVLANNPGSISFVDCAWENMWAPKGVAQIGDSHDAMTFAPTTDVTFEECSFSNLVYDGPMIGVYGQSVTLRRSIFEDLSLPNTIEPCQVEGAMEWCQGLLYCFERSACELEDICVQGVEYAGPAAVATASSQTNLTIIGAQESLGLNLHSSVVSTSSNSTCSTGFAQFEDTDYLHSECLLESIDWTHTNFCPL